MSPGALEIRRALLGDKVGLEVQGHPHLHREPGYSDAQADLNLNVVWKPWPFTPWLESFP